MRRFSSLALGLILVSLAVSQVRSGGGESLSFELASHAEESEGDVRFVAVADSSYTSLVIRCREDEQDPTPLSGSYAVSGFRIAQGTAPSQGSWTLEGQDPVRVKSVLFQGGVAQLPPRCVFDADCKVEVEGRWYACAEKSWPGYLSLLPPAVAIVLAVILREVLLSLLLGILAGVYLIERDPLSAVMRTLDRHLISQARDNFKIIAFTAILGGVVAMIARMGGVRAIVEKVAKRGRSGRGVQVSTWCMGVVVFFDDYANALLVGNTMRPITDRFRISREKLAYLVDCTAAPVACIAPVSTWIATEVGLIQDWLRSSVGGIADYDQGAAYQIFLDSILYNFYPIFALIFSFLIVILGRDFGPMRKAELRAAKHGQVCGPKARPMISEEMQAAEPIKPHRSYWWNGAIPILVLVGSVLVGLYWSGSQALPEVVTRLEAQVAEQAPGAVERLALARRAQVSAARGEYFSSVAELRLIIGSADSENALLWASAAGLLVASLLALLHGLMGLRTIVETSLSGMKAMLGAVMVLILAWTLSDLCKTHLNTAGYLIEQVSLDFNYLPVVVFLLAGLVGFATGSSWGTMGIFIPLTMSYAAFLGAGSTPEEMRSVLLGSIGGVLAGAVFGDHCSPISDTTVMSSMACGSDHLDHVRTQLPYAMVVAFIAVVCGYLPAGFGVSPFICLIAGAALSWIAVRYLGRPSHVATLEGAAAQGGGAP